MKELLYLLSAVLFIVGLKRLSSPRTARFGNTLAATGMLLATVVTLVDFDAVSWGTIIAGLVSGAVVGGLLAVRVQMTSMPQLVAAFNGFGGAASALVALSEIDRFDAVFVDETSVTVVLALAVGSITFSGSFVAYSKLQGLVKGKPFTYQGDQAVNAVFAAAIVGVGVWAVLAEDAAPYWIIAGLASVLGILAVMRIGGGDMPVVISLLNSMSGVAAATAGLVIDNSALIIGGALVGAAGFILAVQMGEAMNRSLAHVLFSGFGGQTVSGPIGDKPVNRATPDDVAIALGYAHHVVVVPGYGLAVAQAQHAVRDLARALERRGVEVSYAIHPRGGTDARPHECPARRSRRAVRAAHGSRPRQPTIPANGCSPHHRANDVVNPSARDDATSPIYGMPILEVDKASTVVVVKRSLSPGFAGIDNPLFYEDNTLMLFADGKAAVESVLSALDGI